ncbi:AAA family ATPase [Corynebacterium sp. CCM 9203]|uniref:AAA family ATPase n=1 Tax=Corynebacterium sp. CCM 9203 TaxID=3057615 RepID=UPI003525A364
MRIHSIILDNVRGIGHLELRDLPESGLIVISGDNEQGKSTILESVRTVLMLPHSSNRREVRTLQPVGADVAPRIELTATVGPYSFTVTKSYLRQKSAVLTVRRPHPENLTGREAEDRLAEILDKYLDTALMDVLFVRQGELDAAVAAAGVPSLARALGGTEDSGSGEDPTFREGEEILRRVEEEYERYYTAARGTETGELKVARANAEYAAAELAEANTDVEKLAEYVEEVRRRSEEESSARARRPDAIRERAELRNAAKQAEQSEARLRAAVNALTAVTATRDALLGARRRREELAAQVTEMEKKLVTLTHERTELATAAAREREKIEEAQKDLSDAERELRQATELVKATELRRKSLLDRLRREELGEILHEIASLDERMSVLREQSSENIVTESAVAEVEAAELELKLARSRRDAASASIALTAEQPTGITVDGEDVVLDGDGLSYDVTGTMTFVVSGITAVITPGSGIEGANADVSSVERSLVDLLRALECPDVDTARKRLVSEQARQRELNTLRREREARLAGREEHALKHEMDSLGAATVDEETEDTDLPAITADLDAAKAKRQEKEDAVALCRARLSALSERRVSGSLAVHDARIEAAQEALQRAEEARITAESGIAGDADTGDLDERIAEQTIAMQHAEDELEAARRELNEVNPGLVTKLLRGAEAQVDSIDETIRLAERAIAENKGRIEQATGAEERLEKAVSAEMRARDSFESTLRRAAAAKRLRETLLRYRDDARRRYAEPFARRLTGMAETVFGPGVSFGLTEELAVAHRTLGDATIDVDSLSVGAREQIGILVRLSVAELVAKDDGVTVFIDDALGSTDGGRLRRMATVLADAGKEGQIFVLTCVPARYDHVPGRHHLVMSDLKKPRE